MFFRALLTALEASGSSGVNKPAMADSLEGLRVSDFFRNVSA